MTIQCPNIPVSDVKLRIVEDGSSGLVAWASCVISNSIKLDNIAIRRGQDGRLFLTYPNKETTSGNKHPYFHPISATASKAVEDAVISKLANLARIAAQGNQQTS